MKAKILGASWQQVLPPVLVIGGVVGLVASFALTYDKIQLLKDPSYQPGCNLNPIFSCGSVMKTEQASLLGVPNTVFGLIAFSMLVMFGVGLLADAKYKRWLWWGAQAAALAGLFAVHYLIFQAIFRIHAICPWCFAVWLVTVPVCVGITVAHIRMSDLPAHRAVTRILHFVERYNADILLVWYAALFVTLLVRFWYYWETLL